MRFLRCLYLFAGFYSTIALTSVAAQQPPAPAQSAPPTVTAKPSAEPSPGQAPAAAAPSAKPAGSSAGAAAAAPSAKPAGSSAGAAPAAPSAKPGASSAGAAPAAVPAATGAAPPASSAPENPAEPSTAAAPTPAESSSPPDASGAAQQAPSESAPPANAAADAAASSTPGEGARLAKQRNVVVAPSHDAERPIVPPPPEGPAESGFAARLSLGLGGALWISGGDTKLSRPFWFGLDLGYAFTRNLTIFARGTSWFPYSDLANEYFGAGAAYRFLAERIYVAPSLGLQFLRQGPASAWTHYFQGLAFDADVGQYFPLSTDTTFSFGAHFQIGTPLFGKKHDAFTSLQAGIFVALGLL